MSEELTFTVAAGEEGRIDRLLGRRFPGASRRRLAELFEARAVRIDGAVARKGDVARAGATVTLVRAPATAADLAPAPEPELALDVLFADDHLVAVAKPAGVPSQPLRAGERGTAAGAIVARFPECRGVGDDPREAGLAHRLDIGTSGVLLAARDGATWRQLRGAFRGGAVVKEYLALVCGRADAGSSDLPLAQRGNHVVVDPLGLPASTRWQVVERLPAHTLLRCTADTGRMHQVRVHLADAGTPVAGDTLYGGAPLPGLVGHFLHAARLELRHPTTGAALVVEAPLPPDRQAALAAARS